MPWCHFLHVSCSWGSLSFLDLQVFLCSDVQCLHIVVSTVLVYLRQKSVSAPLQSILSRVSSSFKGLFCGILEIGRQWLLLVLSLGFITGKQSDYFYLIDKVESSQNGDSNRLVFKSQVYH